MRLCEKCKKVNFMSFQRALNEAFESIGFYTTYELLVQ
jgi:hypothetical protein